MLPSEHHTPIQRGALVRWRCSGGNLQPSVTSDMPSSTSSSDTLCSGSPYVSVYHSIIAAMAASYSSSSSDSTAITPRATRLAGTPEVVHDGETGFLVEPGDVGGLADAIERAWADRDLYQRMAVAGRGLMEAKFDKQRQFGRFLEHFEAISRA